MKGRASIFLLMLRCGYIDGPFRLTSKGSRFIPARVWRAWNRVLCAVKPGHRRAVTDYLSELKARKQSMEPVLRHLNEAKLNDAR